MTNADARTALLNVFAKNGYQRAAILGSNGALNGVSMLTVDALVANGYLRRTVKTFGRGAGKRFVTWVRFTAKGSKTAWGR